jgi:hypothetical protein
MKRRNSKIAAIAATENVETEAGTTKLRILTPPGKNPKRTTEIHFLELDNGGLAEVVENPDNPAETLLALRVGGNVRFVRQLEHRGQILVPIPRSSPELVDVKLPRGVLPYVSVDVVTALATNIISRCISLPIIYHLVVSRFIVYTWIADRLPDAVYLSLVGLPGSGKTTLLDLLRRMCRRSVMVSDVSLSAMTEICTSIAATLLIDENDWDANRGNLARRQLLRAGTTRSATVRKKGSVGQAFGPKVLASLEPPNDPALNSRCIQIPMVEVNDSELWKPSDPRLAQLWDDFQQRMLQFRFDYYSQVKYYAIPGAEELRPRARDILNCLAAPYAECPDDQELLVKFFSELHDPQSREPLSRVQNAVLAALFRVIHSPQDTGYSTISQISGFANSRLRQTGEKVRLQPRKVGAILSSLGFGERVRTNRGLGIYTGANERQQIHTLVKNYGNEYLEDSCLGLFATRCKICAEMAQDSKKK